MCASTALHLQADPFGPDPFELLPNSPTQLFILPSDITFTLQKDANGAVTGLILHAGPQTFQANKIS